VSVQEARVNQAPRCQRHLFNQRLPNLRTTNEFLNILFNKSFINEPLHETPSNETLDFGRTLHHEFLKHESNKHRALKAELFNQPLSNQFLEKLINKSFINGPVYENPNIQTLFIQPIIIHPSRVELQLSSSNDNCGQLKRGRDSALQLASPARLSSGRVPLRILTPLNQT
jgi:hypothetical protein